MLDYLDSLRERPERERQNIALLLALGIASIVLVVWVSVAFHRVELTLEAERTQQAASAQSAAPSFFEIIQNRGGGEEGTR